MNEVIRLEELTRKVDALVEAVDRLSGTMDLKHTGIQQDLQKQLHDVELMKFKYMTELYVKRIPDATGHPITLEDIQSFLFAYGRQIIYRMMDQGYKVRWDERRPSHYKIPLGLYLHDISESTAIRPMRNPRLWLEFNFDLYREPGEYQFIDEIRLVIQGGSMGDKMMAKILPQGRIDRAHWQYWINHFLQALGLSEIADEYQAKSFSQSKSG